MLKSIKVVFKLLEQSGRLIKSPLPRVHLNGGSSLFQPTG